MLPSLQAVFLCCVLALVFLGTALARQCSFEASSSSSSLGCRRRLCDSQYVGGLLDILNLKVQKEKGSARAAWENFAKLQQFTPMPLSAIHGDHSNALRCGEVPASGDGAANATLLCMKPQPDTRHIEKWKRVYDDLLSPQRDCSTGSCRWASVQVCKQSVSVFPPILCEASCDAHLVMSDSPTKVQSPCRHCQCKPGRQYSKVAVDVLEFDGCDEESDEPKWRLAERELLPVMECKCTRKARVPRKCHHLLSQAEQTAAELREVLLNDTLNS